MQEIKRVFDAAKDAYDRGESPLTEIASTSKACLEKLSRLTPTSYGTCSGKNYSIYEDGGHKSRPFLPATFISSPSRYCTAWNSLVGSKDERAHGFTVSATHVDEVIYTTVMAFALCYDLWKPKSRKTPGTYFEVVLGSLMAVLLPEATRTKFISLGPLDRSGNYATSTKATETFVRDSDAVEAAVDDGDLDDERTESRKVSTDIVFNLPSNKGIVIPAKITTRERIVQPFAHQRILDSAFGEGRYISLLACVSETQRDDADQAVNEICVPGTIGLFQEYLAKLGGIYYLDIPRRYAALGETGLIEIDSIGSLLTKRLGSIVR